jgi:formylglycine-generating enzyme required for sulfatase activity
LALGNDVFLEFVKIPAGTFMMGVPDSEEEAVPSVVEG